MGTEVVGRWGTWEELLLGGAVLRHGTRNWNVVAAELRSRTLFPYTFTPEVCKAKYEDLQQQYSGSMAWFEELRKKRVAELKRALELSEDSIGSLESKIESLKTGKKNEKRNDCDVDNESDSPELHMPTLNLERVESSTKEMSKDGLSAGSFTHETRTNWSPECQVPAVSADNMEIKLETEQDKVVNVDKSARTIYEVQGGYFKKRRGKRKRKECGRNTKEASVGESDLLDSTDVLSWCKESSTSNCGELAKSCGVDDQNRNSKRDGVEYVMDILDSIFETKSASTFRRRLDSQKRGRYKKMIRRHMDFDTIRSRISSQTIKSGIEIFRDLLLLTNNSLVFYSKSTREYKSALLLRDLVTIKMRESFKDVRISKVTQTHCSIKLHAHSNSNNNTHVNVKPRSVRPGNRKIVAKAIVVGGNNSASLVSEGTKKPSKSDSPSSVESLPFKKKAFGRPKKVARGTSGQRPALPMKGKKRVRTKS
ncbi:putative transcription factor MYB-related family [Lupinus albus]|uniref:Putative transcription factor MYB-related family n=1 Tax=Lupinus albus TaxID=3870 RepID=A0A6A4NVI6_LUPAL|nr:putative transcription factor MYB-related family [Lupinus albus]